MNFGQPKLDLPLGNQCVAGVTEKIDGTTLQFCQLGMTGRAKADDLEPLASGIINILLPGNYGADALANILAGDANPSAKMPYTYPRHQAALTTYDYRVSEEMDKMEGAYDYDAVISVQWPFGYGLSYSTFEYSDATLSKSEIGVSESLKASVTVTNNGPYDGDDVVQLYIRDEYGSVTRPVKELKRFTRVTLKPGEKKSVSFELPVSELAFWNIDMAKVVEPGDFGLWVATDSQSGEEVFFKVVD